MERLKDGIRVLFVPILVFSFIALLCFSSFGAISQDYQFTYATDENGNIIDSSQTHDVEKVIKEQPKDFPNKKIAEDFFKQKKANNDTIAWIMIPELAYYPIMYNNSNQFYLSHNNFKKFYPPGAIFMNRFSKGSFDNIALIHGHRMLNGTMFGSLGKYEDGNFFRNSKPIEVFDGKKIMYYKVYTVFLYKDGVQFVNQTKQKRGPERTKYFKKLASLSRAKVEKDLNINYDADMLFLQTCDYDFDNARLIIGAYKLGEVSFNQKETYRKIVEKRNEINNIFERIE